MSKRGEAPQVSAGSMADIAFLLLIFFLVTTSIETDAGLDRMLPRVQDPPPIVDIHKRNILPVLIDEKGKLLVDGELIDLIDLRATTISFLDNGGATIGDNDYCNYCQGGRDSKSSDGPSKAIVSLMSSRETSYGAYIAVQNELVSAYNLLRNREAQRLYKIDFTAMEALYGNFEIPKATRKELKSKIRKIQELYPMKLSEAELN